MNPLALGMMACGLLLFVLGLFLVSRHRKTVGIAISMMGLGTAAAPLVITFFLLG